MCNASAKVGLDPDEALVLEMLASSAAILRSAVRRGYIDRELNWTRAGLALESVAKIPGFQLDLILSREDIAEEIEFFRSGRALHWMEWLGIYGMDCEDAVNRLTGR